MDLGTVLRFIDAAVDALSAAREEIDALNVYPVPDGDTGTNMFLTFSAARDALREVADADPDVDLAAALAAFTRGGLLGARGNSGVILSQMLGAFVGRMGAPRPGEGVPQVLAQAMHEATEASYAAVGEPVEGTILTVARAASDAALKYAQSPRAHARDLFAVSAAVAREALAHTPEQLATLAEAGVVDAGGRGLSVILDAAETVMTGRRPPPTPASQRPQHRRHIPIPSRPTTTARGAGHAAPTGGDLAADGPAYEVMYLLEAPDDAIPALKATLLPLGDSLVVVGDAGLWNVHVHVDDVGAAIEAGVEAGRPHRIRVTHFAEQVAAAREKVAARKGRAVVAVAAGPGLADLFRDAGATVVMGGPRSRPSTGMLLSAITACGAAEVIVLPNDPDSLRVAEIAARTAEEDHGIEVAVVNTHAQVQGLAAIAVHEPGRRFEQDVMEMTATARHARHGAVTIAARQAMTMGGPCEPGDVLGVIEGDFALVGSDQYDVASSVVDRLLGGGGELVTLVAGAEDDQELAVRCAAYIEDRYPHVDAVVYDGGQERYPLLLSVE